MTMTSSLFWLARSREVLKVIETRVGRQRRPSYRCVVVRGLAERDDDKAAALRRVQPATVIENVGRVGRYGRRQAHIVVIRRGAGLHLAQVVGILVGRWRAIRPRRLGICAREQPRPMVLGGRVVPTDEVAL